MFRRLSQALDPTVTNLRLGYRAGLRPCRRLVASSMKYSSDRQLVLMAVVDNVTLDRKRSNARAELRTSTTHPRLLHQEIESVDDGVNQSVGGCGAGVLGDVGPDLLEVPLGQSGEPDRASTTSWRAPHDRAT